MAFVARLLAHAVVCNDTNAAAFAASCFLGLLPKHKSELHLVKGGDQGSLFDGEDELQDAQKAAAE